jgi:hypothetical protein
MLNYLVLVCWRRALWREWSSWLLFYERCVDSIDSVSFWYLWVSVCPCSRIAVLLRWCLDNRWRTAMSRMIGCTLLKQKHGLKHCRFRHCEKYAAARVTFNLANFAFLIVNSLAHSLRANSFCLVTNLKSKSDDLEQSFS